MRAFVRAVFTAFIFLLAIPGVALGWAPIVGTGSCGGPNYSPGVYVFFFHATANPEGATYDATAYPGPNWAPGFAVLDQSFNAVTWDAAVTTNVGPKLWVRWHADTSVVVEIDASPLCDSKPTPKPTPHPSGSVGTPASSHPEVTPPPTSTDLGEAMVRSGNVAKIALLVGLMSFIVLLSTTRFWPRDDQW